MNLTSENKAIGKENFYAAIGSDVKPKKDGVEMPGRRDVLKERIEQGHLAGGTPGWAYFGYESSVTSPLRVGVIGTGDEGSVLIGAINPDFIEVKSIADIRPYNQYRAFHGDWYSPAALAVRPGLMKIYERDWKTENAARKNVKVYGPYQELIANAKDDDVEAVIIALPLHLHAAAAIAAMKAGLHVLTEKLMGHSVCECKEMARVAKETNKHLATGHQRHYNILYDNAVDLIKRGILGDLHYIRAQWHRRNMPDRDSWKQPMPEAVKPKDSLAGRLERELKSWEGKLKDAKDPRDIELWTNRVAQKKAQIADEILGSKAREFGYKDAVIDGVYNRPAVEELIRWRLWDRTGGGLMAELGSHQLDAASIFVAAVHGGEKQYPLSVGAAANRPIFPADRDVDDHVFCVFEFPAPDYDPKDPNEALKRIGVHYASINGNDYGGYGETVFGTKGTLLLEREKDVMLWQTSQVGSKIKVVEKTDKDTKEKYPEIEVNDAGDPESVAYGKMATKDAGRGYRQEIEHWAWCVRKNPDNSDPNMHPKCDPKVALGDAVIALSTNMAAHKGLRVEFKPQWFDPDDDATPERDILGEKVKPDVSKYA